MAFYIPKIQYKNYSLTGTTASGNGTITGISSTANLEVGMFVRGAGIPTGATILSKTSTTVTLAGGLLASASATVTINYGFEIIFSYPPIEPNGEQFDPKETVTTSLAGVNQTIVDYVEGFRSLTFSFLSESIKNQMETFARYWYCLGKTFRYFDDQNSVSYIEYESKDRKYLPVKITGKGENIYIWKLQLAFRRLL